MSPTAQLVCYIVAFVCFVLVAANISHPRISFLGLGLAAWVLVPLALALEAV